MSSSRLLDVAIREFGHKGLEGASTRGIAAAAGTAMSSITYHYGGKEGLYAAAADHIDGRMAEQMAGVLPDGEAPVDAVAARAEAKRLLDRLLVKFLGDDDVDWSLFIMREQMQPTGAFDRLYRGTMGELSRRLVLLVQVATGAPEREARITALSLLGAVVVWRSSRALAERLFDGPVEADGEAAIRRHVAADVDSIFDRLSADPPRPPDQKEPQ